MYPYTYIQNQITRKIDYIGFISQDAIGPTDYDLEGPPPGKKKCYGFLEQSPKKTIGRVQKEQVDKLQSIIEKANRITDKLGRRCYLIMLKSEPLNNDCLLYTSTAWEYDGCGRLSTVSLNNGADPFVYGYHASTDCWKRLITPIPSGDGTPGKKNGIC